MLTTLQAGESPSNTTKFLRAQLWVLFVLGMITVASPGAAQKNVSIAIIESGPSDNYRRSADVFIEELKSLFRNSDERLAFKRSVSDFSLSRTRALFDNAMRDDEIDLVVGLGVRIGQVIGESQEELSKPVFLPFAAPALQGISREGNRSGRKNLSYLTGLIDLERELQKFREVMRRKRVVVLADKHYFDAFKNLDKTIRLLSGDDVAIEIVAAEQSVDEILSAIPKDAEAVYIGPLLMLPHSEEQALIDGLNLRKLPSFASEGRRWTERGAFVSLTPKDDERRRLRRVALFVDETLRGAKPEEFATTISLREELLINMNTARAIGVWPRFDLMIDAELIGDSRVEKTESISLEEAVGRALKHNLDIQNALIGQRKSERDVDNGLGRLMPSIDASADFTWLDPDVSSPFANPERNLQWGMQAKQVVYSPRAFTGYEAVKDLLRAARANTNVVELNIVSETATAYLDVLRAMTAEKITRENLARLRQNLNLAEVRVEVGSAGKQEVLRWKAELADGRAEMLRASARRAQSEIKLSRVVNGDLAEGLSAKSVEEGGIDLVIDPRLREFVNDPWSFAVFQRFMVSEALANAPELRQLDAAISAKENIASGLRQALFIPDIGIGGGFVNNLARGGKGAGGLPPGTGFPQRDNFTWQFGATLNFRVFDMSRYAELNKADDEVDELRVQRDNVAQAVRMRVLAALQNIGASSSAVGLRREAAEAAAQNLELVRDAYQQGTLSVVNLIDAQTQALQTQLLAGNAHYDFLVDFIQVERATGAFGMLRSAEDRESFVKRLIEHVQKVRGSDR